MRFVRVGQVERGPKYEWRDAYSWNGTTQPWMTMREAQTFARAEGGKAVFVEKGEASATHNPEILAGIPSGVWADAWATRQEERGRSFSGQDIMAAAPKPPPRARAWGKKIAGEIVRLNSERHGKPVSLEDLYQAAVGAGYPHDREHFGYHLGMQAVGHGVSFSDDCSLRHDAIAIPDDEFYY